MRTPFGDIPDRFVPDMSMADMNDYLKRRPVSRRTVLGAAVLGAASPLLLTARATAAAAGPVGPRRLAYGNDPATQMNVTFSAPQPFDSGRVEYGTGLDFGSTAAADDRVSAGATGRYGSALLTGLAPDTQYSYRVRVDDQVSAPGTFRTAPLDVRPFTFTAFADQGITAAAARTVARIKALKPAFHLVAGDLCYADTTGLGVAPDASHPAVWDRWLEMIEPLAAQTPWMVAAGNHEMEPGAGEQGYGGLLARMQMPRNGVTGSPATYWFRYGNVGFIALDSNDVSYEIPANFGYTGLKQSSWLERVLAQMRSPDSDVDFIVAYFHHCPYATNGAHGSEGGVREKWTPLFDRYSVDLVVTGHNHCYERTRAIRSGAGTDESTDRVNSINGTTYLTVGGGGRDINKTFLAGATQTRLSFSPRRNMIENVDWSIVRSPTHSFITVDVIPSTTGGQNQMSVQAIATANGSVLDHFVLQRTSTRAVSTDGRSSASETGQNDLRVPLLIGGAGIAAAAAGAVGYRAFARGPGTSW